MTPHDVFLEARKRGLQIKAAGNKLAVMPKGACPSDFAVVLRQHKAELLDLLESMSANLPPDCAPWLHTARQILAGEFDGCDRSTGESLTIGLRAIRHSSCQRALQRLLASHPG